MYGVGFLACDFRLIEAQEFLRRNGDRDLLGVVIAVAGYAIHYLRFPDRYGAQPVTTERGLEQLAQWIPSMPGMALEVTVYVGLDSDRALIVRLPDASWRHSDRRAQASALRPSRASG